MPGASGRLPGSVEVRPAVLGVLAGKKTTWRNGLGRKEIRVLPLATPDPRQESGRQHYSTGRPSELWAVVRLAQVPMCTGPCSDQVTELLGGWSLREADRFDLG